MRGGEPSTTLECGASEGIMSALYKSPESLSLPGHNQLSPDTPSSVVTVVPGSMYLQVAPVYPPLPSSRLRYLDFGDSSALG